MKKMNVTFKCMLGFVFVLALMFGTTTTNAQSDFINATPDFAGVSGTKDLSLAQSFSFTGVNFLTVDEAKAALVQASTQKQDDFDDASDIVQNQAYVTVKFYRNTIEGINQTGEVASALLSAYSQLVQDADDSTFNDFIFPVSIFEDTVDMLSN